MVEAFIGEIRLTSFNVVPNGWALCNGQLLPISQNEALYSIIGATYGGDGTTNFALPNLNGRVAIHPDQGISRGTSGGEEAHVLTNSEMPRHAHRIHTGGGADSPNPAGHGWGENKSFSLYDTHLEGDHSMNANALSSTGDHSPHSNMQPYLVLNYIIAIQGIYPSRP